LAGSLVAANAAMAQQPNPGNSNAPTAPQMAPPASSQQGGPQGAQPLEQLSPQQAQQLAREPEIQQVLNDYPSKAKDAITKAAEAQSGQLIGVTQWTQMNGGTTYMGYVDRGGTVFVIEVGADGKLLGWKPKMHY
jgi:hypothetical protein